MTSPWIETVTEKDFEEKVISASKQVPVLVDFWAPWCGPCRMLGPLLERVVDSFQGRVRLAKINTDENPNLAYRFGIQGIPAVKAFKDGQIAAEFVGAIPERQVREFINSLIPSEADRLSQEAKGLEKSDPSRALKLYDEALKHQAHHAPAWIGKLGVLMALNRIEEVQDLFSRLPTVVQGHPEFPRLSALLDIARAVQGVPSVEELRARLQREPDHLEALWSLAVRHSAQGNYREALEAYLSILKKDRKFKDDGARKAILQLFEVIGTRSPLADEYREKLARTLY